MNVKIIKKSKCSRLVMLVQKETWSGNCKSPDGETICHVFLYQGYIVYFIYGIRYLIVLEYVLSVIMVEQKRFYIALCYVLNRIWNTVVCVL